ncbi:MAG: hypothetical protein P8P98_06150 [Emcibacteraceae bacterium]|nr:hypothetical protein [Emcibacteraceae bacterium]MDG1996805.1 hypothetical protein [Emcibacteraceae bacterium]
MSLKNFDRKFFSHKSLSTLMKIFGSFLIAVGPLYAYFIFTTVGSDKLGEVLWEFTGAVLALPAGIFIAIVGKNLKTPIMDVDAKAEDQE